ncbi:(Fe-S)-binding protein [Klebsiella pneumoniae subsp. pneumoniae]|nr:(Fe-S)-binding protein [Klebsiella pneumoniae subsp. pneumoniae]
MPLVGVDPALVLCYRDEYKQTLGDKRGDFQVLLVHEWLPKAQPATPVPDLGGEPWYPAPGHCTEVTALPAATKQWADIFAHFGAKLENVSVGCCGMAGTYGHEGEKPRQLVGHLRALLAAGDAAAAAKPLSGDGLLLPQSGEAY